MPRQKTESVKRTAVILAGKRPGVDPVAAAHGEILKAKVRVCGKPMLTRVIGALSQSTHIGHIVVIAGDGLGDIDAIDGLPEAAQGVPISTVSAAATISDSVLKALESRPAGETFLVTTSDHPLLTASMIDEFLQKSALEGVSVAFVEKGVIEDSYPGMRRTYLPFRQANLSGANLFVIAGNDAIPVVKFFQQIEANRKHPLKMASMFGLVNLLGILFRAFTPEQAFARLSKVLKCPIRPVELSEADAAVDVDRPEDLAVVNRIISERSGRENADAAPPSELSA